MKALFLLAMLPLLLTGSISYEDSPRMEQLAPSIIRVRYSPTTKAGGGTGFFTRDLNGITRVVTNEHVCSSSTDGKYMYGEKNGVFSILTIMYTDEIFDLCLLSSSEAEGRALFRAQRIYLYEEYYLLGYPLLRPLTPSKGVTTNKERVWVPTDNTKE